MELPDRCDRSWFVQTFMGGPSEQNENANEEDDVWPFIKAFNMYDPLCCIAALFLVRSQASSDLHTAIKTAHWLLDSAEDIHRSFQMVHNVKVGTYYGAKAEMVPLM